MSAPVPPFTDWSRANLIREVKRARKGEQRYKRALGQIAALTLKCYAVDLARKALRGKP